MHENRRTVVKSLGTLTGMGILAESASDIATARQNKSCTDEERIIADVDERVSVEDVDMSDGAVCIGELRTEDRFEDDEVCFEDIELTNGADQGMDLSVDNASFPQRLEEETVSVGAEIADGADPMEVDGIDDVQPMLLPPATQTIIQDVPFDFQNPSQSLATLIIDALTGGLLGDFIQLCNFVQNIVRRVGSFLGPIFGVLNFLGGLFG